MENAIIREVRELCRCGRYHEALRVLDSRQKSGGEDVEAETSLRIEIKEKVDLFDTCLQATLEPLSPERWVRVYGDDDSSNDTGLRTDFFQKDGVLSLRFSSTFDVRPSCLLACAREWDLLKTWNKYCPNTEIVRENSLLSIDVYGELWLPWPFSNRFVVMRAEGFDALDEHGCIVATLSGLGTGLGCGIKSECELDERSRGRVPSTVEAATECILLEGSCIKLTPLPDGRTHAVLVAHADPRIPTVPTTLINLFIKIMTPWIHGMLNEQLKLMPQDSSPYRSRMEENRELYGLVDERTLPFIEHAPGDEISKGEDNDKDKDG